MDITKRFSEDAILTLREEIADADGAEVFFAGFADDDGVIVSVEAASRGTDSAVLVQSAAEAGADALIHNHPSGVLKPSAADMAAAHRAERASKGFFIIDNEATKVFAVLEIPKKKQIVPIDENVAARFLSKDGDFAKKQKNFEERESQIALLRHICRAFNENKIGVFEAGTGVGKSFAYLIPAILWAKENAERVVISTGTINLQQQLAEKDVPQACLIAGKAVKSVLVKGRQNYVCRRRLSDAVDERDFFEEDIAEVELIYKWAKTSSTGDRADLIAPVSDGTWGRVCSESDACMGLKCPFRDECFVMKLRKEASDAQILIVNNHLFFADIAAREEGIGFDEAAVLPPYSRVIFDEAHGIEESATSFFSRRLNRFSLLKQLNLLYREGRKSAGGFLFTVMALSTAENSRDEISAATDAVKTALDAMDASILPFLEKEQTLRVCKETAAQLSDVFIKIDGLSRAIGAFTGAVKKVLDGVKDEDSEVQAVWEAKNILERFNGFSEILHGFLAWKEKDESVFWFQRASIDSTGPEGTRAFAVLTQTPLDIAPTMSEGVFSNLASAVCVSATLKIEGTFDFWTSRTGVLLADKNRVVFGEFPSPFPYEKRVLFSVPEDFPFPDSPDFQLASENAVRDLCIAANGRTLVLFTSYDALRRTALAVGDSLSENAITLLKQGDGDRFRLLESFKNDAQSVLFATDSFWEGVDVPGESLSQVIIVKLPFSVPSDPVFAARAELVEKNGGSAFMSLSVPQAVIKFRQGFGRLMRRGDDCGTIVVLDKRIVEKRYGSIFTKSVAKTYRLYEPIDEITKITSRFLKSLSNSESSQ